MVGGRDVSVDLLSTASTQAKYNNTLPLPIPPLLKHAVLFFFSQPAVTRIPRAGWLGDQRRPGSWGQAVRDRGRAGRPGFDEYGPAVRGESCFPVGLLKGCRRRQEIFLEGQAKQIDCPRTETFFLYWGWDPIHTPSTAFSCQCSRRYLSGDRYVSHAVGKGDGF